MLKWAKDWKKHFTKEDMWIVKKHVKRCPSLVIREMQIQTVMRYYYTLSRMAKLERWSWLTIPGTHEAREQLELSYIAGGNAKCAATSEYSFTIVYKGKHTLTIKPSNPISKYLFTKWDENSWAHKNLYISVCNSFMYNHINWKQSKCLSTGEERKL